MSAGLSRRSGGDLRWDCFGKRPARLSAPPPRNLCSGTLEIGSQLNHVALGTARCDAGPREEFFFAAGEIVEITVEEISRILEPDEWREGGATTFFTRECRWHAFGS